MEALKTDHPGGPVLVTDQEESRQAGSLGDRRQPFLNHLEQLRRRILRIVVWVLCGAGLSWAAADRILAELIEPVGQVVFVSPAEPFLIHLKVAIFSGILISFPLLAWEVWGFLAPAVYPRERRTLFFCLPVSVPLFFLGAWFGWKLLLPTALTFLLSFSSQQLTPMLTVANYLSFASWIIGASGLLFQTPVVVLLLTRLGWVTPRTLLRQWRLAVIGILLFAALLTPTPDVATQIVLSIPMVFLYLLSVGFAFLVTRHEPS